MVEKKHGKWKYKEGNIFQHKKKIKNGINEMANRGLFLGNMNLCSSKLNQSMKISRDFSLERRHTQNKVNPNIQKKYQI